MRQITGFSLFIVRLLFTSIVALTAQIIMIIRFPDYLLVIQDAIKQGTTSLFRQVDINSSYRVAYNLLNGDGILVHTVFVIAAFMVLYLLFALIKNMFR